MRKPPGLRHEKVSANKGDQPDNREQSQAHLPDLQGSWFVRAHSASKKQSCVLARKFITAMCEARKHLLWKEPIRERLVRRLAKVEFPLCTCVSSAVQCL